MHARRLLGLAGPGVATLAAIAALVAWSFAQRWLVLAESPFPVGVDGYFYPVQLRAVIAGQPLPYATSPLAFYLMAPFAAVAGPITGAKLGAAAFGALAVVPAYGLGARLGGSRGAGLVAAAIVATSAGSMFLTFEFVKNGVGVTVALAAMWALLAALDRPSRPRLVLALVAWIAAALTHKTAGALVIVIGVPAAVGTLVARGQLRGRRLLYLVAAASVLAIGAVIAAAIAPTWFLSGRHVELVRDTVTLDPAKVVWYSPALSLPYGELVVGYEAVLGWFAAVLAAITMRHLVSALPRRPAADRATVWTMIGLGLAIGTPWLDVTDPQGLGFRLRLLAFVPLALCAAVSTRLLVAAVGRLATRLRAPARAHALADLVLAVLACVLVIAIPARDDGRVDAHPAMVSAVQQLAPHVSPGAAVIVPERHTMFMVAWYARVPVRLRPESVPHDQRLRLLPGLFVGDGSELDRALDDARGVPGLRVIGVHARRANGLVLVDEPTWCWLLSRLSRAERWRYAAWPTI